MHNTYGAGTCDDVPLEGCSAYSSTECGSSSASQKIPDLFDFVCLDLDPTYPYGSCSAENYDICAYEIYCAYDDVGEQCLPVENETIPWDEINGNIGCTDVYGVYGILEE